MTSTLTSLTRSATGALASLQDHCLITQCTHADSRTDVCLLLIGRMNTGLKGEALPCVTCEVAPETHRACMAAV